MNIIQYHYNVNYCEYDYAVDEDVKDDSKQL